MHLRCVFIYLFHSLCLKVGHARRWDLLGDKHRFLHLLRCWVVVPGVLINKLTYQNLEGKIRAFEKVEEEITFLFSVHDDLKLHFA